jgi:hypothetical protein
LFNRKQDVILVQILNIAMEENLIIAVPDFKLYNSTSVYIGTFFGGPLVAGYFAAENLKKLGKPVQARNAWAVAVAMTIIVFAAAIYIPGLDKMPPLIIPLIYTAIAQFFMTKYQGQAIKAHISQGGKFYTPWRSLWIGLIGAVILIAIVFILLYLNFTLTVLGSKPVDFRG